MSTGAPTLTRLPTSSAASFAPVTFLEITRATFDYTWVETSEYLDDLAATLAVVAAGEPLSARLGAGGTEPEYVYAVGNIAEVEGGVAFMLGRVQSSRFDRLFDTSVGRWDEQLDLLVDESFFVCAVARGTHTLSVVCVSGSGSAAEIETPLGQLLAAAEDGRVSSPEYRPAVWWFVDPVVKVAEFESLVRSLQKILRLRFGVHLPNPSPSLPGDVGRLFGDRAGVTEVEVDARADVRTAGIPIDDRSVLELLAHVRKRVIRFFEIVGLTGSGDRVAISSDELRVVRSDAVAGSFEEVSEMLIAQSRTAQKAA